MPVSLKIKGNKRNSDGVGAELLSIGDDRFHVLDEQYSGAGRVTDFIVIRHLADKSVYTLVTKNVTPSDSQRPGTLYVSVAVPVGEQVSGLFQMLLELSGYYKSNYMTFDGLNYKFTQRQESAKGFEDIIERHPVSEYPYKPVVSLPDETAIAYIFMKPDQIAEVLNDPMRPEFARYGQIVLVPVADPAAATSTFNLPARIWRNYRIFVNGKETSQTIADPAKIVNITIPETETHEAASVRFSIATSRAKQVPGVVVDDHSQIIYVKIQPVAKVIEKPDPANSPEAKQARAKRKKLIVTSAAIIGTIAIVAVAAMLLGLFGGSKPAAPPTGVSSSNVVDKDSIDAISATTAPDGSVDKSKEKAADTKTNDDKAGKKEKETKSDATSNAKSAKKTNDGMADYYGVNNKQEDESDATDDSQVKMLIENINNLSFQDTDLEGMKVSIGNANTDGRYDAEIDKIILIEDVFASLHSMNQDNYIATLTELAEKCRPTMPKLSEILERRAKANEADLKTNFRTDKRLTTFAPLKKK